ncbi:hypothetical protein EJ04DRAFT_513864 [Polyplosphaeria fusca]|uniref:B30.2/SPRY domain-containing protein n=1 Tax=Polyplosphaeria fusca TaxID=682080 RepID=A0A9P4QTQ3_9PLEO|nr:hypothetical protein EJ04DRAFT_513864 [Polyplosphaeria fusca]
MAPTAAGQYYWASILAPKSWSGVASYATGWVSVAVSQGLVALTGFLCATLIEGIVTLHSLNPGFNPSDLTSGPSAFFTPKGWIGTLILGSILLVAFSVNALLSTHLTRIEGLVLYLHLFGFIAILVPLLYLSDHVPASTVFVTFSNEGAWPDMSLAFLVGMITNVGSLMGSETTVRLSDEVHSVARVIPCHTLITLVINGILGFAMLVGILFCLTDPESALNSPTGYPFIQVFFDASASVGGTTAAAAILLLISFSSILGQFASASRQLWAISRDKGLPGSKWLQDLNMKQHLPFHAMYATLVMPMFLGIAIVGSAAGLLNLLSFVVSSWLLAAAIPLSLLLWRRITGRIKNPYDIPPSASSSPDLEKNKIQEEGLEWGPWRMPEPIGSLVNIFALCWILLATFFSIWPQNATVNASNMNYSSLMVSAWLIVGIAWFAIWGHKTYTGPVNET